MVLSASQSEKKFYLLKAWWWELGSDSIKTDYKQNDKRGSDEIRYLFFFLWWMTVQPHISGLSRPLFLHEIILNMDDTWWTLIVTLFFVSEYAFKRLCGLLVLSFVRNSIAELTLQKSMPRMRVKIRASLICANVWWHVFAWCHPRTVSFLRQIKYHFKHLHRRSIISASATVSVFCVALTFFVKGRRHSLNSLLMCCCIYYFFNLPSSVWL